MIDWEFVSTDTKGWYGFPVHVALVKEWLDTGKYKNEEAALYESMCNTTVFSGLPSESPLRWLIRILRWFYFKQQNYLGIDGQQPELEKTYNLYPVLIAYLYNEYYQFFKGHYVFKVDDQIQRLIDRRPDDWVLGIVSAYRTKEEIELILSDQFSATKEYSEAFTYKFCTDSPIRFSEPPTTPEIPENIEVVSNEIDDFGSESEVYILSNAAYSKYIHSDSVDVIEVWGDKTIDDFEFDNPGQVLVVPNSVETPANVENESVPDIENIQQAEEELRVSFAKDHEIINNLGKSGFKPTHVALFIFMFMVVILISYSVADQLESIYEVNGGHWFAVIIVMLLSGGFCSFIPVLIYSVSEIKTKEIETTILLGFGGGVLATVLTAFEHMNNGIGGVFALTTFLSFFYTLEYNKEIKERLTKCEKHECN